MTKNSQSPVKKSGGKNRLIQIAVVVVIVVFAFYFIFSSIMNNKKDYNPGVEKSMTNETTYTFVKEGELAFAQADGKTISALDVEIADNDDQRMTGLMFRTNMKENQGMLFIFPYETEQSFWMKNTVLPLDMIFVNADLEIVKIHHNTTPYSEQSYSSGKPAQYVVEVNAGYCNKLNIIEGDKILFNRK
jgi:uncharacterized protein